MEKTISKNKIENWDKIQELYPDNFVLILNPEYSSCLRLKRGVLVYKNKIRNKVVERAIKLGLPYITIQYTGGTREDNLDENLLLL